MARRCGEAACAAAAPSDSPGAVWHRARASGCARWGTAAALDDFERQIGVQRDRLAFQTCDELQGCRPADVDDRRLHARQWWRLRRAEIGVVDAGDRHVVGHADAELATGEHRAYREHV